MTAGAITILDGGMGRELERVGAPFRQPEWSALALIEAPAYVRRVHEAYIEAGADIVTTNSYAIVPFHIGEDRFAAQGERLADLAGRLGREAIAATGRRGVRLAGSLPPVFGSYRPDLFRPEDAQRLLGTLVSGLAPHVDIWLAETLGSITEAVAVRQAVSAVPDRPLWISFTLDDLDPAAVARGERPSVLRSGEETALAAKTALALGAEAVLFNCSHAAVMEAAVRAAQAAFAELAEPPRIGVYANAFAPHDHDSEPAANEDLHDLRDDLDPAAYAALARQWHKAGASIIGGCCGIGPDYIRALAKSPVSEGVASDKSGKHDFNR